MLPIYVFSSSQVAQAVFKGIAEFVGTGDFTNLIAIAGTFSLVGAVILYIQHHDLRVFARWFAIYFVITAGMLGIKTDIKILDPNDSAQNYQVDNVPLGLALPAYLVSTISYSIAEDLTSVFGMGAADADNKNYLKTGMLFDARLYYAVTQGVQIRRGDLRENIMDFTRQCVIPDIAINHKYEIQDLVSAPDLLQFLSNQPQGMSPLRGIYMGGAFKTCAEALPLITTAVSQQVNDQTTWLSHLLYGDAPVDSVEVNKKLVQVYQTMFDRKQAQTAQDILVQSMMVSALREGIQTSFASSNAPAAMLNYSESDALQKQLLGDNSVARTAIYVLPLLQMVLFLICVGLFPLMMLFAMQPWIFVSMLKSYLSALIYLGIWPSLFVIINFIMTAALGHAMNGIANQYGMGVTLANQNMLLYTAQQFAGYTGYLIAFVPLMAGFLFFAIRKTFTSSAQMVVGSMQSGMSPSAAVIAEEQGNVNSGHHAENHWTANHSHLNASNFKGMSSRTEHTDPQSIVQVSIADNDEKLFSEQEESVLKKELSLEKSRTFQQATMNNVGFELEERKIFNAKLKHQ